MPTTIVKRADKGAPLTHQELDQNFENLRATADAAYAPANILGVVSQAGGVPTGAIMEYGSNANGEYWRYAGGMQICVAQAMALAFANSSNLLKTWTYPAGFIAPPNVNPQLDLTNYALKIHGTTKEVYARNIIASSAVIGIASAGLWVAGDEALVTIDAIAIGRWF